MRQVRGKSRYGQGLFWWILMGAVKRALCTESRCVPRTEPQRLPKRSIDARSCFCSQSFVIRVADGSNADAICFLLWLES